jgi:photosystem II stability/assembly factor-like uncharacterized protein
LAVTYGTVLNTRDGGTNWEILMDDKKMWLYGLTSIEENKIWLTGDYGELLHSSDGGKHWSTQIPWE